MPKIRLPHGAFQDSWTFFLLVVFWFCNKQNSLVYSFSLTDLGLACRVDGMTQTNDLCLQASSPRRRRFIFRLICRLLRRRLDHNLRQLTKT